MKKRWKVLFAAKYGSMWRKRLCATKLEAYYWAFCLIRAGFNVRIERGEE